MQMKMSRWMAAGMVVAMLLAGTWAQAQDAAAPAEAQAQVQAPVLAQVPSGAMLVVRVKNVQDVSQKIGALAQQWGLAAFSPEAADPLGALQQKTRMTAGVNAGGDLAIVFMPPADGGEPKGLVLVPVSDYKAFLGNFADAATEGDVTEVTIGGTPAAAEGEEGEENLDAAGGEAAFVAQWGNYAAISNEREVVATKPEAAGLTLPGLAAQEMAQKDAVVYFNMPQMRPQMMQGLQMIQDQVTRQMAMAQQQADVPDAQKQLLPVGKAMVDQVFAMIGRYVQDTQAATLGVNLDAQGIRSTLVSQFDPASTSGQTVAQVKNSNESLLTGLPDEKYLLYSGFVIDPQVGTKLVEELLGPVATQLNAAGDAGKPILDYIDATKRVLAACNSGASAWVMPSGPLGQQGMMQFISVLNGDAKTIGEAYRQMMQTQEQLMQAFGTPPGQVKLTFTPNAKTVDGVTFDQYQMQFNMQPKTPQEFQAQQMMTFMYGPQGWTLYQGQVDANHYLAVAGADEALLAKAVAAVKAGNNPAQAAQAVAAQLPQNRVAVVYVPVDNIVSMAVTTAQQFGMPAQLNLPANLPPVGMTIGTEGSAVRMDSYVPSQLVQSLIAAGMQMQMQMQGGGGPGGQPGMEPAQPEEEGL